LSFRDVKDFCDKSGRSSYDLRGTSVISFIWGFGELSNNLAETYVLLCGLILVNEVNIRALLIFRDLMIVIKIMISKSILKGHKLKNIISQIK
jgi:hypothetical protein